MRLYKFNILSTHFPVSPQIKISDKKLKISQVTVNSYHMGEKKVMNLVMGMLSSVMWINPVTERRQSKTFLPKKT